MACRRLRRSSGSRTASCRPRRWLGSSCRTRGSSRGNSVAAMTATLSSGVTDGVVDGPPVSGLDVLPRLVVREGGLVAERLRGRSRVCGIGLCGCRERKSQSHGCSQPKVFLFHYRSHLNADAGGRPMPVRTHERHQASRGGLNGSDGSGRTLLAVRDEARRRSVEMWKNGGERLRL